MSHRWILAKGSPRPGRQPQFSRRRTPPASSADGHPLFHRSLSKVGMIVGCIIAGLLAGTLARWWIGGIKGQRTQLHQCVVASQDAHPGENAGAMLARFQAEVPDCMDSAGYAKALGNSNCGRTLWQGDVYCYEPKNRFGRLLFKIETAL
jgi:hypothetical protein